MRYVIPCTLSLAAMLDASAAELQVTVVQPDGSPATEVVVDAVPPVPAPPLRASPRVLMDQKNLMFVPDTIVIRSGSTVEFPNSDDVRHQVYSFSPAKTFQLSLYDRNQRASMLFDKAGLITVGCNIHDAMIGYIYVTDSPWFGQTSADGSLQLRNVTPGRYMIRIWHSRLRDRPGSLDQPVDVPATGASITIRMRQGLRPVQHNHGSQKQWEDY